MIPWHLSLGGARSSEDTICGCSGHTSLLPMLGSLPILTWFLCLPAVSLRRAHCCGQLTRPGHGKHYQSPETSMLDKLADPEYNLLLGDSFGEDFSSESPFLWSSLVSVQVSSSLACQNGSWLSSLKPAGHHKQEITQPSSKHWHALSGTDFHLEILPLAKLTLEVSPKLFICRK